MATSQPAFTAEPSSDGDITRAPAEPTKISESPDPPVPSTAESLKRPPPPFWTEHQRSISTVSYCSVHKSYRRQGIALEDNTEIETEENNVVWAKCVTIEDYTIVAGRGLGDWAPGTYVVWNCTVETLDGGTIKLIKR